MARDEHILARLTRNRRAARVGLVPGHCRLILVEQQQASRPFARRADIRLTCRLTSFPGYLTLTLV